MAGQVRFASVRARVRTIADGLLRPVQFLLYLLSGFVPRDPHVWAFGTWSGHRFADNAAAVFVQLAEHPEPGVSTVWITRERSILDELRAGGHRCHLVWSPGGVWWTVRAGVMVYDSVPKDVNFWLSRGASLVLLRHGIGMKKIERAIDVPDHRLYKLFHGTPIQRVLYSIALPWHLPIPDLVLACSEEHADQAVEYFGVERAAVVITGFPRHDRLIAANMPRSSIPTLDGPVPDEIPVFLYLPTFREGAGRQSFDWSAMEDAADGAGATVAVKLHYMDDTRGVRDLDRVCSSPHLRLIDPSIDPVGIYPAADGMITDFSSAAFDFMLLRRPIIYFVPDLDEFRRRRPLMYEVDEIAVGPICHDPAGLVRALGRAVEAGVGTDADRYDEIVARFHRYPPGEGATRTVAAIRTLIE